MDAFKLTVISWAVTQSPLARRYELERRVRLNSHA